MKKETLRWGGNAHRFFLTQIGKTVKADLVVNKGPGAFATYSVVTSETNVGSTAKSWNENWQDAYVRDTMDENKRFFAIRTLEVTGEGCWVWTVDHRDNIPGDSLVFIPNVTHDEIEAAYKDE